MVNDVMDVLGLMEGIINLAKLLYFAVASITAKLWILCQKTNYQPNADLLIFNKRHLREPMIS
jgi:hypothetical protein